MPRASERKRQKESEREREGGGEHSLVKNILNVHPTTPSPTCTMLLQAFLTVPVVDVSLLTIREHLIG